MTEQSDKSNQSAQQYRAPYISPDEFYEQYPRPIVLHYQPDSFAILKDPEDLRKWEEAMRERVGIAEFQVGAFTECPCETGCPSNACDTE